YLSRKDSSCLLMVGTGSLAPYMIRAHAAVRPVEQVLIWGRRRERARAIAERLRNELDCEIDAVGEIEEGLRRADIISCATLSPDPLVYGRFLRPGQHLDLVGSFKPDMREADDETVRRASLYVDTREGACRESGDIHIPLSKGIIEEKDVLADLFTLCRQDRFARKSEEEITLFKSVGYALEDLVAARQAFEKFKSE
ncbi:MAG: ornithine cyclodeaminase family protein, partial [Saprospiraceae bacterium]|nr:ornithine cyclodeaminase family protein [Saprospiraceae bacterium]